VTATNLGPNGTNWLAVASCDKENPIFLGTALDLVERSCNLLVLNRLPILLEDDLESLGDLGVGGARDRPWLCIFSSHKVQHKRQNHRLSGIGRQ